MSCEILDPGRGVAWQVGRQAGSIVGLQSSKSLFQTKAGKQKSRAWEILGLGLGLAKVEEHGDFSFFLETRFMEKYISIVTFYNAQTVVSKEKDEELLL